MDAWKAANAMTQALGRIQNSSGSPLDVEKVENILEQSQVYAISPNRVTLDEKFVVLAIGVDDKNNIVMVTTRVWNRDRWLNLVAKVAGLVLFALATHIGEVF